MPILEVCKVQLGVFDQELCLKLLELLLRFYPIVKEFFINFGQPVVIFPNHILSFSTATVLVQKLLVHRSLRDFRLDLIVTGGISSLRCLLIHQKRFWYLIIKQMISLALIDQIEYMDRAARPIRVTGTQLNQVKSSWHAFKRR